MKLSEKLQGERVILKCPDATSALANELFKVGEESRDHLLPWLNWVPKTKSSEDSYNFLKFVNSNWDNGSKFEYGILTVDQNRLIGIISVFNISVEKKEAEIGYWISKHASNKGFMSEALNLLHKHLYDKGIENIVLEIDAQNEKSLKLAQRLGYSMREGPEHLRYSNVLKEDRKMSFFVKNTK